MSDCAFQDSAAAGVDKDEQDEDEDDVAVQQTAQMLGQTSLTTPANTNNTNSQPQLPVPPQAGLEKTRFKKKIQPSGFFWGFGVLGVYTN